MFVSLHQKLLQLEATGKPIRIGMVGAGMGAEGAVAPEPARSMRPRPLVGRYAQSAMTYSGRVFGE